VLAKDLSLDDIIQPSNYQENLFVLTAGNCTPGMGRQLASTRMKELMAKFDATFDLVIYDSPHVTKVPLGVRANWLRQLYPAAHVIEAWGGPQEVGLEPGLTLLHEEYLLKILGSTKVTHFFSSEPYGEHVSKRLGAVNVQVDVNRSKFPATSCILLYGPFLNVATPCFSKPAATKTVIFVAGILYCFKIFKAQSRHVCNEVSQRTATS
jgi:hypothetical protein